MAKSRIPAAKAAAIGAEIKNPKRFASRTEPKTDALGGAPAHHPLHAKRAWARFKTELPWLTAADAALLGTASVVRGQMLAGEIPGVTKLSMGSVKPDAPAGNW